MCSSGVFCLRGKKCVLRLIVVAIAYFVLLVTSSFAASAKLSWNRNQEPDIAGYQIFWGIKPQQYSNRITISDTSHEPIKRSYTINGLKKGATYYFALKAIDLSGKTSPFSPEIAYYVKSDLSAASLGFDIFNNTIPNGDIENGDSSVSSWSFVDWSSRNRLTNEVPGEWSNSEAHSGTHSLHIHNEHGTMAAWHSEWIVFSYPYPKVLSIGGWSKASNVYEGSWLYGLVGLVFFEDDSYSWFFSSQLQYDRGSHGWQFKSVIKKWDKGVKRIILYATLYGGTGSVWFDDIYIVPSPSNMIVNGDFEVALKSGDPLNWRSYDAPVNGAPVNENLGELVDDENHSGAFSVFLNNQTGSRAGWRGEEVVFDPPYPKILTFTGWSKALAVDPDVRFYGLDFRVVLEDGTVRWYGPRELRFSTETHDWEQKRVTKRWDKGVRSVRPYCLFYQGTGMVWFDDISIKAEWN